MLLHTQRLQVQGDLRAARGFLRDLVAFVVAKTEHPIGLYRVDDGAPLGTFLSASLMESRATWAAAMAQLVEDQQYQDLIASGRQYLAGAPENSFLQVLHNSGGDYQRTEVGGVVRSLTGVVVHGKSVAAGRWLTEWADLLAELTGRPVMTGLLQSGVYPRMQIVWNARDLQGHEAAMEQAVKDPRYFELLDQNAGLFVDGLTEALSATRIA